MDRPDSAPGDLREAGRGFLLITGAKAWFLITATFTSLAFPRLFGDAAAFGQFRVVSGVLNVLTMVVVTASVQAVARMSADAGANVSGVLRTAVKVQAAVFGPVFLAMLLGSGVLASEFLHDEALALPLAVSSVVILAYAFYSVLVGVLNGTRRFGRQAGLDVAFSTLKTGLMVAAVVATGSVTWAFGAFATTAVVVLILAIPVAVAALQADAVGRGTETSSRAYLRYLLPLALYALFLNLLLQADVVALKAILGGRAGEGAAEAASAVAGVYGAARNVSLLPYQAVISLTFVVFPLVSRATSRGDRVTASAAASGAIRLAAVLSWLAVGLLGAAPEGLLSILFGQDYAGGGQVLVPLLAAGAMMAGTYVGNAVLASAGRPAAPLWAGLASLAVLAGGLWVALAGVEGEAAAMSGAAWATLAAAATGFVVNGALVAATFGEAPWLKTTLLAAVGAIAGLAASTALPDTISPAIHTTISGAVFLVVLVATGGIGPEDGRRVLGMVSRRR